MSQCTTFKAVYLDTNVFFACHFNFSDSRLKKLSELTFSHGIELWSSDIAYTELQVAMRERLREIDSAIDRAKNILTHCVGEMPLSESFLPSATLKALQAAESFFRNEYVRLLNVYDLDETDISRVFSDYFNRRGCFASDKKRSEFPDAFQVAMILRNVRNSESVAVVSQDRDFTNALGSISQVRVFPSLEKLIANLEELPLPTAPNIRPTVAPTADRPSLTELQDDVLSRILDDYESVDTLSPEMAHDAERIISDNVIWTALGELVRHGYAMPYRYEKTSMKYEVCRMPLVLSPEIWFYRTTLGYQEYERQHF